MLECSDGSLYTGWTVDPVKRFRAHQTGRGAKYTRARLPVRMVGLARCSSQQEARRLEPQLKKLSRQDKLLWTKENPPAQFPELSASMRSIE